MWYEVETRNYENSRWEIADDAANQKVVFSDSRSECRFQHSTLAKGTSKGSSKFTEWGTEWLAHTDKPGCLFLLAKCLKNTCGRGLHLYLKCHSSTDVFQTTTWFLHGENIGRKWVNIGWKAVSSQLLQSWSCDSQLTVRNNAEASQKGQFTFKLFFKKLMVWVKLSYVHILRGS